ncbi:uncharacterized protein LOC128206810 [Mya arenaria]|uniref:uncharacterized protein LOC128206810 n=1 Tax=Mya arenaria TaxID=6604 RepID=UPI0022E31AC8|nr:uncharacterized protein LOC128206810 [Mya arenaria]
MNTSVSVSVLAAIVLALYDVTDVGARLTSDKLAFRRFLHGCPFAFPCALPPCENPVFGPGNCCGSCPEPEMTSSTTERVTTSGNSIDNEDPKSLFGDPEKRDITPPTISPNQPHHTHLTTTTIYPIPTTECSDPCRFNGTLFCFQIPCDEPCVDGLKLPGNCCRICLHGSNCMHDGHIIPEGRNVTMSGGEVVNCVRGGVHGEVQIYHRTDKVVG